MFLLQLNVQRAQVVHPRHPLATAPPLSYSGPRREVCGQSRSRQGSSHCGGTTEPAGEINSSFTHMHTHICTHASYTYNSIVNSEDTILT